MIKSVKDVQYEISEIVKRQWFFSFLFLIFKLMK
jgi:hypothetical protein